MNDRAFRVSLSYVTDQTEENLDSNKIKELAKEALSSYYPTFLHTYLRSLDITEIISLMFFVTKQFGDKEPQDFLEKALLPVKVKILNAIGDSALLEKGSLLDKVTAYFNENPPKQEDDIDQYVQHLLNEIKNNTKRTGPKMDRIITQY